ncbi:late membrane protein-like protein [Seal parapoxvirus]|uniref:Late membrane protein-like protein n=1 Tax=Seal parapoxvirus TaxID=187984 RepID=A0A1Z3GCU6_9POXV|nr:late membrane protein-like protein [Seal parapoxvirus]ASC55585.1 late membrane protein-like protein [Seal parapoxvirus]
MLFQQRAVSVNSPDEEIYAFCDAHPNDEKCACLKPSQAVVDTGRDTRLPYYCWYGPCKRVDALLPRALKKNIARCNVSDCVISLGDVRVSDAVIRLTNACGSKLDSTAERFYARYLNQHTFVPVADPQVWIPLCLVAVASLAVLPFFSREPRTLSGLQSQRQ